MVDYFFLVIIILGLALTNYLIAKSILYPPCLYCLVWLMVICSYFLVRYFGLIEIDPISYQSALIFTYGALVFSIGGAAGMFFMTSYPKRCEGIEQKININKIADGIFFIIPVLLLPIYIYKAYLLSQVGHGVNFMMKLRESLTTGGYSYGFLTYCYTLSFCDVLVRFLLLDKIDSIAYRCKFYMAALVLLVYAVFGTGRTAILMTITSLIFVAFFTNRLRKKYLLMAFISFVILYVLIGISMHKGGAIHLSFADNLRLTWNTFIQYMLGGMVAFDKWYHSLAIVTNHDIGWNVFKSIYVFLNKIGLYPIKPESNIQEFVGVPFLTNVYTVYYVYIKDFNWWLAFMFVMVFGFTHTILYIKAKKGRMFFILMASVLYYPLLMSFFHDQYLSLLSMWCQLITIYWIMIKLIVSRRSMNAPCTTKLITEKYNG